MPFSHPHGGQGAAIAAFSSSNVRYSLMLSEGWYFSFEARDFNELDASMPSRTALFKAPFNTA